MTIKKTALLLDQELVKQVQEVLGTSTTTETISEALREVLRVRGRARHFERLRQRSLDLLDPEVNAEAWAKGERRLGAWGDGCGDPPR
jgi:Arc/MetJ family transcription regulator